MPLTTSLRDSTINGTLRATGHVFLAEDGICCGFFVGSSNASAVFVKLYNMVTVPNPAVDVPYAVFKIPPNDSGTIDLPRLHFTVGLAARVCTGYADTDNTDVAAGDVTFNVFVEK